MKSTEFTDAILNWYYQHGRKDLPWRQEISPYRVWISEIMLQQTQVQTVIPYFHRFVQHFPTLKHLAQANEDEVLHLWTGLGYYARARNLLRTAKYIEKEYQGQFPADLTLLQQLPGIGRSTAGAILAISKNQRAPILDGNVKRVLTRFHAMEGWPGSTQNMKRLWELAETYTPYENVDDYTQAIMDLGATLCTPKSPQCGKCPVKHSCKAHILSKEQELPHSKPKKVLPLKKLYWLIMYNEHNEIFLEKRPQFGLWAGLWSFPECNLETSDIKNWCEMHFGCQVTDIKTRANFRHTFSHFHLEVTPVQLFIKKYSHLISDAELGRWQSLTSPIKYGLASPVKRLLVELKREMNVQNCALC